MLSKRDIRYQRGSRFTMLTSICFGGISILCALSLAIYNPNHHSLFYHATDAIPAHSIIEHILFQIGPILLFLLGAGAVPLCLLLLDCAWKRWNNRRFFDDSAHALVLLLLLVFTAACAAALQADIFGKINPGGLVGHHVLLMMRTLVGVQFEKIGVLSVFFLCATIVLRPALLFLLNCCMSVGRYIMTKAHICKTLYRALYSVCAGLFFFLSRIAHSLFSMLQGTFFEKAEQDFVEIEYGDVNNQVGLQQSTSAEYTKQEEPAGELNQSYEKKGRHISNHVPREQQGVYSAPNLDIFVADKEYAEDKTMTRELEKRAHMLEQKLERFGITGLVTAIKRGPVVTVFEYQPSIDSKLSKIIALEDDLALALQALSIRIIAPIPGTNVVGFEVANNTRKSVQFGSIVKSEGFMRSNAQLPLVIGQDTLAQSIIVDLAKMPHLLVAGSTGSGKSVALNGMLISLLCRCGPQEMKLVLIDPKRLEFAPYADIGHLLFPIVTDVKKVAPILRYIIQEMERRYDMMAQEGARNIFDFHAQHGKEALPFIVVIIDELADLMMTVGRDVEDLITRIAQMARAAGIHMILATQRPSVDVITGLIKVNFPSRISFRVTSKVDSRTILDVTGAEKLLGKGDMLFLDASTSGLRRAHGAYVSDQEIQAIVAHIRAQGKPDYVDDAILEQTTSSRDEPLDDMMPEITVFLATIDEVSISLLQRKFRIGYNRSARIMEQLEQQGRILPSDGGKMRKVVR